MRHQKSEYSSKINSAFSFDKNPNIRVESFSSRPSSMIILLLIIASKLSFSRTIPYSSKPNIRERLTLLEWKWIWLEMERASNQKRKFYHTLLISSCQASFFQTVKQWQFIAKATHTRLGAKSWEIFFKLLSESKKISE